MARTKESEDVRSLLGLTQYYITFIKGYAIISKPLANLFKKDGFMWNPEAEKAFHTLKNAIVTALVLALLDFQQQFIVETYASSHGLGGSSQQGKHPMAFISRKLGTKRQRLSIYKKELLAIVFAIQKCEQYLMGRPFTIKTDQKRLKHLLELKISTPFQ